MKAINQKSPKTSLELIKTELDEHNYNSMIYGWFIAIYYTDSVVIEGSEMMAKLQRITNKSLVIFNSSEFGTCLTTEEHYEINKKSPLIWQ